LSKGGEVGEVEEMYFSDRTLLLQRPDSEPTSGQCWVVRGTVGSMIGRCTVFVTGCTGPASGHLLTYADMGD
jgi:hypothetical protein